MYEDNEDEIPEFEAAKMERFVAKEPLLRFAVEDLHKRNPKESREYILEVVFNGYVADDYTMQREYEGS